MRTLSTACWPASPICSTSGGASRSRRPSRRQRPPALRGSRWPTEVSRPRRTSKPDGETGRVSHRLSAYPTWVVSKVVLGVCAIVAGVAVVAAAAPARKPPTAQKLVLKAIAAQAAMGHITPGDAARYRAAVNRAALLARRLPPYRGALLESQLRQAAAIAPKLTEPRALAIFGQIEANDNWFARHGPPPPQTDITDADGVVYRYFAGKGFEFHPLGNFAA